MSKIISNRALVGFNIQLRLEETPGDEDVKVFMKIPGIWDSEIEVTEHLSTAVIERLFSDSKAEDK